MNTEEDRPVRTRQEGEVLDLELASIQDREIARYDEGHRFVIRVGLDLRHQGRRQSRVGMVGLVAHTSACEGDEVHAYSEEAKKEAHLW